MKKSSNPGLPPWPRRALELASFSAAPQSILPLARSSLQGLKKPYSMNSNVTKSPFNPSDTITIPSSSADSNNKESQNQSFPIDNKNSSTKDLATDPAFASSGDKPVKTRAMITGFQTRAARAIDPNMDPRKLKRVISNRVSAQKSRLKRLQYLADIERKVKALEEEIAALSPQVALYKSHHQALKMEQRMLSMEMSARTSNKILKDAEIEDNKAEVSRLRQLHLTQQEVMWAGWANGFDQHEMAGNPNMFQLSLERIAYMTSIQAKTGESSEGTQKLSQRSGGWRCVLGWDPTEQEMANPSLHRSGSSTALNMNTQLGGVQKTMTFNSMPINQDLDK